MKATPMSFDRRLKRSENTHRAMTLQLEHILKLYGLRNFTLCDNNGLVIAYAGYVEESDAVAAFAPVLARCADRQKRSAIIRDALGQLDCAQSLDIQVRSFFLDGERLYLCITGEPGAQLDVGLYRAIEGLRRIYRETAPVAA